MKEVEVRLMTRPQRRDHAGDEGAAEVEDRVGVDREGIAPLLVGHLEEALHRVGAGVVDEDVDPTEALLDRGGEVGDVPFERDVDVVDERLDARRLNRRLGVVGRLFVGGDDDVGAVLREPHRQRLADALGGAGDQRDPSLESSRGTHGARVLQALHLAPP
jgi:hypothetical protein